MTRTMNRLILRLAMLCIAVVLGAIAVAQAQKGLDTAEPIPGATLETRPVVAQAVPIQQPGGFQPATDLPPASFQPEPPSSYTEPSSSYTQAPSTFVPEETPQPVPASSFEEASYDSSYYDRSSDAGPTNDGWADNQPEPQNLPEPQYVASIPDPVAVVTDAVSDATSNTLSAAASAIGAATEATVDTVSAAADVAADTVGEYVAPIAEAADREVIAPTREAVGAASATAVQFISSAKDTLEGAAEPRQLTPPPLDSYQRPEPTHVAQVDSSQFPDLPINSDYTPPAPIETAAPAGNFGGGNDFATQQNDFPTQPNNFQMTPPADNSYGGGTATNQPNTGTAFPQMADSRFGEGGQPSFGGGTDGSGKPGPPEMEGPQTPTLTVVKSSPPEVQVNKPAKFKITVRNVGNVDAHDVLIRDEVPHGTQLVGTSPQAGKSADGALLWQMGTLKAGAEASVTMEVVPTAEGDIGSVATVSFQTSATSKSIATRPQLTLEHTGPGEVLVGEDVVFHIKLSNPGTGVATGVTIEENVPQGLRHVDGQELEYLVGTLRPGETRLLELTLKADKPGPVENLLVARADANISANSNCRVNIVAPSLQVGIDGPTKRYLERRAKFSIQIANPGTAPAYDVEIAARLPRGLKFVSTNNAGQYSSADHTVYWSLAELPAQEMGTVELTAVPIDMGSQRIRAESKARMGLSDAADHTVNVEGLAALLFTVTDVTDPIEVGGQTTYEIHVVNQGSKEANNIRVAAMVPPGMQAINGDGPTRATVDGQRVLFDPLGRLTPQGDTLYKIYVKGTSPGDKRIQVQLVSDEITEAVTKEESTHVYADQ